MIMAVNDQDQDKLDNKMSLQIYLAVLTKTSNLPNVLLNPSVHQVY